MGLMSRAALSVFPPKDFVQKLKSSLQMVQITFCFKWFVVSNGIAISIIIIALLHVTIVV